MSQRSRKVCLLAHYGHHITIFKAFKAGLPDHVRGQLKLIYALTPRSMLFRSDPPDSMSEDDIADIIEPFRLISIPRNPELDMPQWNEKLRRRAVQWYRLFMRDLKDADLLVTWNGRSIPLGAANLAAKHLGKKVAFCDNGVLPGMIAMDPKGINYANSLTGKDANFYRSIPYDENEIDNLYNTIWPQRPLRKAQTRQDTNDLDETKPLPERYVLYAMQVQADSQIQLFSPRFRNMIDSVTYVYHQVQEHNRRTGDTLCLVAKEHPSDYGNVDYMTLRKDLPDVRFLRSTPIRDLIKSAQVIITINSSVAVEAMFSRHPIITLGLAFYNIPGLICNIDFDKELADELPELLSDSVDEELRKHFLYFLWKHYLIPNPDIDNTGSSIGAQRLIEIMDDRLPW